MERQNKLVWTSELLDTIENFSAIRNTSYPQWIETIITTAPAVDAAEVVRCEDCMFNGSPTHCPMCHEEYDNEEGWYLDDNVESNGFCHRGKRKDAETN